MRFKDTRATWQLAWPIAIGQLATTGTAFVDTVMAGHVSAGDLAAVSVGSAIWMTLSLTMLGYLLATSPMVAHKVGAKESASIASLTQQALVQALILTIGIMYLVEFSTFSIIALLVAKLGAASVAAHQIALNFGSVVFMVPMAIAAALTVRVGHAVF